MDWFQIMKMGEELTTARERMKLMNQPQSFLLEQLQQAKEAKKQLEPRLETLQAALQVCYEL